MAIRRCPYCKAIIDEQDKYCNNCGTQLLFPEDEFVEEEIPGDRIVDEPTTEEESQEVEEPGQAGERRLPAEEEEEQEEGEELEREAGRVEEDREKIEAAKKGAREEEYEEQGEEPEEEEDEEEEDEEDFEEFEETEEEEPEEEFEREAEGKEKEAEEEEAEANEEAEEKREKFEEEEKEEEIEELALKTGRDQSAEDLKLVDDLQKKYEVSIEEDELVFRTKDIKRPTTEVLPPWAKGMREKPPQTADLDKIEEPDTKGPGIPGKSPAVPEWAADSGIGMPEKITQSPLPFGTTPVAEMAEAREPAAAEREAVEKGAMPREFGAPVRDRGRFGLKLKSKLVDLVFITALWLISLFFTAQVIGVSFLQLISGSPIPVLAFYFILLFLYFFLFLFFLGETLGDHYFSGED